MKLHAKINIYLDAPFHVYSALTASRPGDKDREIDHENCFDFQEIPLEFQWKEFEISIFMVHELVDNPRLVGHLAPGVRTLRVDISTDVKRFESEGEEYSKIQQQYSVALFHVVNGLLKYFRYRKGNPYLRPLNGGNIKTWIWVDQHGEELHIHSKGGYLAHFPGLPGSKASLGSSGLKRCDLDDIRAILSTEVKVSVVDELLAQGREAIFDDAFLYAALLLAVAVEVRVKTSFLGTNSAASNAFDFSQEKGRIEISPIEFIDKIAKLTYAESFKDRHSEEFHDIEYLFRCRNKIAHRGRGVYSDKKGVLQALDKKTIYRWWYSVDALLKWLGDIEFRLPPDNSESLLKEN